MASDNYFFPLLTMTTAELRSRLDRTDSTEEAAEIVAELIKRQESKRA